jgi:hypothetical protein
LRAEFGRGTLKERDSVGEINVDGRIMLKWLFLKYGVIKKDGLNFVRLYFLNYIWYVNDLYNI